MVPRARLELAHLSAADFESAASTDSATGAIGARIIHESPPGFKSIAAREGFGEGSGDQRGGANSGLWRDAFDMDDDGAWGIAPTDPNAPLPIDPNATDVAPTPTN